MPREYTLSALSYHFHIPDQSSEPLTQVSFHGIYATWIHAPVHGQHLHSPIYCTYVVNKHSHLQHTFEASLNHQGVKLQPVTRLRNHVDANVGEHRPRI